MEVIEVTVFEHRVNCNPDRVKPDVPSQGARKSGMVRHAHISGDGRSQQLLLPDAVDDWGVRGQSGSFHRWLCGGA